MDKQIILAVDDNGKFLKYIPKITGHKGQGQRHLAIAVLIYNSQNQVLLQKRKHKIFDNIWDLTGATHPLHQETKDESIEEATRRCLREEWGISTTLKLRGVFNYFAPYHIVQGEFCENEHCYLLTGKYDGEVKLNPEAGYEYKWIDKQEFIKDISQNPQNYTPWAKKAVKVLNNLTKCSIL